MAQKIGIFGATFDPPHCGHLIAVEFARDILKLDTVMMIPASRNPLKQEHIPAPDRIRMEMVKSAIAGRPGYEFSDMEIRRGGISFMCDTIDEIRKEISSDDLLYLLVGLDAAAEFDKWKNPGEILTVARLVVFDRPGTPTLEPGAGLPVSTIKIKIPQIEISSTLIRRRVKEGRSIYFLTPDPVVAIIKREKLYR